MLLPTSSPSSSPSSHDECDEVLFGGGSDHLQDIALNPELKHRQVGGRGGGGGGYSEKVHRNI